MYETLFYVQHKQIKCMEMKRNNFSFVLEVLEVDWDAKN